MNYRTDLALERRELLRDQAPPGVSCEQQMAGETRITRIRVRDAQGARAIGKPCGRYVTLEIPRVSLNPQESEKEIELIAGELSAMLPQKGCVLIVGLGNREITPDAIGPQTVRFCLATRHIAGQLPHFSFRPTAALAPGVMGQTGIETGEIVSGVVRETGACAVIAVDALASRSTARLGRTVQMSDTGISPGSGVGNARAELSQKTLGVPVIAVGVPTVVDAATVALDALKDGGEQYLDEESLRGFMVTPREIDTLVAGISRVLALAIGRALQPTLSASELYFLTL